MVVDISKNYFHTANSKFIIHMKCLKNHSEIKILTGCNIVSGVLKTQNLRFYIRLGS